MNNLSRVGIGFGDDRETATSKSLRYIADDFITVLNNAKRIALKPNLVQPSCADACTDSRVIRKLLLDFPEILEKEVIIVEGSSVGSTRSGFKRLGYEALAREFGFDLVDVNEDDSSDLTLYDTKRNRITARASNTLLDSDLRVSVCPAKTHDTVIATLSIKNCCVGALKGSDKTLIHQGYPIANLNIALLARYLHPHFSIVDAFAPMEGDGPTDGSCVRRGIVISGVDPVSVDSFTSRLMGFDPENIGYLHYCSLIGLGRLKREEIDPIGDDCLRGFAPLKPHSSFASQLGWIFHDDFAYEALEIPRPQNR